MQTRLRHWVLTGLVTGATCLSLSAHEDDPKLRDRQGPHRGPGIRTGAPAAGTKSAAGPGSPFASQGVQLLSWLTLDDFGGFSAANDCWGYTSPSGREYAIIGLSSATSFVDITNPGSPQILATLSGPSSTWRDMKTYDEYCYAVSEGGNGIQVFDLTAIDSGNVNYLGDVTVGGSTTATHNVAIDEVSGFLYRTGGSSHGLRIYDLNQSRTNPPFVGQWNTRYVHDAQIKTFTSGPHAGKQIAFCCSGFNGGSTDTGLTIVDVTNKANPVAIGQSAYSNRAYSHQGWLSEDGTLFYLQDELDEDGSFPSTCNVMDVSNLNNPFQIGSFTNGNPAITHNCYTHQGLMYTANYRSGLRVFDLNQSATNPPETFWFDTYPSDDGAAFNGLWSVFPYFDSGVVIGSDIERGLFVWWVGALPVALDVQGGAPALLNPSGDTVPVTITENVPGALQTGTETLHFNTGSGWQSTPLVSQGGSAYNANFAGAPCGTPIQWYVSADSTSGLTWNHPDLGPATPFQSNFATGEVVVIADDFEGAQGWTAGIPGDDASTGIWTRADPVGTAAQPEDDHTVAPGTRCFFTGQGSPGGGLGTNDVDDGTTTLVSPSLDLSSLQSPIVSYWRWYSNDQGGSPNADTFEVQVSNGGPWVTVETVGPSGPETAGGWFFHSFSVTSFVSLSSNVQVRFRASDLGSGSIVEAAVDDFEVRDVQCSGGGPSSYCTPKLNSQLCLPTIASNGSPSLTSGQPFDVTASNIVDGKNGILFYGFAANSLPFQGGTLCVMPPTQRTGVQASGGAAPCSGTFTFDFQALIQGGSDPGLGLGVDVFSQYWFRDPADPSGFGTGLTDGLQFTIQG